MNINRSFKDFIKRIFRQVFVGMQRLGLDVLPRHFYSEIPDIRKLRGDSAWRKPYSLIGVAGSDISEQLSNATEVMSCVDGELAMATHKLACQQNGEAGFGQVESAFLYAIVRQRRPAHILQIGCGVSTAVCLQAAAEVDGYAPVITCIEPYPTPFLSTLAAKGVIKLIKERAQDVSLSVITDLPSNCLFFVDSSHTLGPSGEVTRIILEMLPRLKAGALVHFHDIKLPYDYDRRILDSALFFPHESPLLHAFLVHNRRFKLFVSMSMLHYARANDLASLLPGYSAQGNTDGLAQGTGHFPSSTYLEVIE